MLLDGDSALELEESELFEQESAMDPDQLTAPLAPALAAAAAEVTAQSEGDTESDEDGIVLESECSSSDAEADDVEELSYRLASLQSSFENEKGALGAAHAEAPLATSHSSQVGSLKTFGGLSFTAKRLFGSEGDLAVSMPVHGMRPSLPLLAARRQVVPVDPGMSSNLGTSMPISIPMMQRRKSAADLGATEAAAAVRGASTFVPPHMLPRGDDEEGGQPPMEAGVSLGLGLSPSAGGKREKLLARNAILRSTGFIEVQQPVAAVIGEVLDPVKDQLLASAQALPVPGLRADGRDAPRSSLTQLLGSSK
ncbi:hypothetical protein ABPG77_005838 [Micractinium sp. CCAP 211/92]